MSPRQRNTLWLSIGAPLLVALLAWGFAKYDSSKVDQAQFTRLENKVDRVLDVVCEIKPSRQCSEP